MLILSTDSPPLLVRVTLCDRTRPSLEQVRMPHRLTRLPTVRGHRPHDPMKLVEPAVLAVVTTALLPLPSVLVSVATARRRRVPPIRTFLRGPPSVPEHGAMDPLPLEQHPL